MTGTDADRMKEVFQRLLSHLASGYLLHGSKRKLNILEPREAQNSEPSYSIGTHRAIYGAANVRIPVIKALLSARDPTVTDWYHRYEDDGHRIVVSGTNLGFTAGFVYVLGRDSFVEIEDSQGRTEIVSYQPIVPKESLRITPAILEHLNVQIIDGPRI